MQTAASAVAAVRRAIERHADATRTSAALWLGVLGLLLLAIAGVSDGYLHRGIETGAEQPYVVHETGRELATNVDLAGLDAAQLDAVVSALQKNGFRYARQSFVWSEIEPARGTYQWDQYDAIVGALTAHNVIPVAVLDGSPDWARSPATRGQPDAPPANAPDYAAFVGAVVAHYGAQVPFVQLWDLPNRPDHWGGTPARPAEYMTLAAQGANASRKANPGVKVLLAQFDPRPPGGGEPDVAFLRDIYRVGGQPFFDIVAIELPGGGRSPYDRSVAADRLNLSRAELFRSVMDRANDRAKPIWATRYGWQAGDGAGQVSQRDQADFTVAGLERARAEWPWMGPMFMWDLLPRGDAPAGYALLNGDGSATAVFSALGAFASAGNFAVATTGFAPVHAASASYTGDWRDQHLNGRTYITTSQIGATMTFRFRGTGLTAYLRQGPNAGAVHMTLDGDVIPLDLQLYKSVDRAILLASGMDDTTHTLTLRLEQQGTLTVGGMEVERAVPLMWPIVVLAVAGGLLLVLALREVAYLAAIQAGALQRRRGVELLPPLPHLPDWRPSRRT